MAKSTPSCCSRPRSAASYLSAGAWARRGDKVLSAEISAVRPTALPSYRPGKLASNLKQLPRTCVWGIRPRLLHPDPASASLNLVIWVAGRDLEAGINHHVGYHFFTNGLGIGKNKADEALIFLGRWRCSGFEAPAASPQGPAWPFLPAATPLGARHGRRQPFADKAAVTVTPPERGHHRRVRHRVAGPSPRGPAPPAPSPRGPPPPRAATPATAAPWY